MSKVRGVTTGNRENHEGDSAMAALFAYGTLMCEDIMRSVAGIVPPARKGRVHGYRRLAVKDEQYPGIIQADGCEVDGVVYFGISAASWKRLDMFEGEMYARRLVEVELVDGGMEEAFIYVVKPEHVPRLASRDWDFAAFLRKGKKDFVDFYDGYDAIKK